MHSKKSNLNSHRRTFVLNSTIFGAKKLGSRLSLEDIRFSLLWLNKAFLRHKIKRLSVVLISVTILEERIMFENTNFLNTYFKMNSLVKQRNYKIKFRKELQNQLLFIDPALIQYMLAPRVLGAMNRRFSGGVVSSEMFRNTTVPFSLSPKYRYCYAHWIGGLSWEDSGAFAFYRTRLAKNGVTDKMRNLDEVKSRLDDLDSLFLHTLRTQRLLTRFELGITGSNFDERGGIFVHFNENGIPIFGGGGNHRLAIGKLVNLKRIPVCIGLVHKNYEDKLLETLVNKRLLTS